MGEGRQLFVRFNCSGCHGGRAGGGMGPSLRDVDWIYGNNDAQLFSSITEGRAHGMPSWQTRLTRGSDVEARHLHQVASDAERAAGAADRIEDHSCRALRITVRVAVMLMRS